MNPGASADVVRLDAATAEVQQAAAAGWLLARGLVAGDRVAVDHDGSPAYLAVVIGALRCGIVPVPLADGMPDGDRQHLLADSGARDRVGRADWGEVLGHEPTALGPLPLARPMLYTSGTTGRRKGVWFGVWTPELARAAFLDEHDQWGFAPTDRHLVCSPLYHSAPLRFAMHTLLAGGEVILPGRFEPERVARLLADGEVTTSFMVPAHLQRIVDSDPPPPSDHVRWIAHAGSHCPEPLKRRVLEWMPPERVVEFYGSTEAQFSVCRGDEWLRWPGTVGTARRGRRLRIDESGVIWCRQPAFGRFVYWNDDEKTARAWQGDECTVGDLGRLDGEGRLELRGRREDLVVSGGVNVYPAEVERVLVEHPGVEACAAFGVDDERWGQRVVVVWIGSADADDLERHARFHLPPASRPKEYLQVEELPVGVLGKVSRTALADWYARTPR